MSQTSPRAVTPAYELRFQSLFHSGRALAFPCDACGRVLVTGLSERARAAFEAAHALVGREYAVPVIQRSPLH